MGSASPEASVPPVGSTLCYLARRASDVDQVSVPPPELLTVTFWDAGFGPTSGASKVRLVRFRPIFGVLLTFNVTSITRGEFDAPLSLTVICVVYVPSSEERRVGEKGMGSDAPDARVMLVGSTLSHVAASGTDADQFTVPPPALLTVTFWNTGFGPTSGALKVRSVKLRPILGVLLTFNVTSITRGEFDAPISLTVICVVYVP